jgi:glycosyltransferase involved in cell wall biosynthesis
VQYPLISVLVCTHNRAHLVRKTMDSIFAQSYQPVEIIVVDDGSTDDTPAVMESYGNRIAYHRLAVNGGIAAARTAACQLARGELIAFQDDDDLMPADRITTLYDALCRFPSAVYAVGDLATIDEQGRPTGGRWLPEQPGRETCLVKDAYAAVLWPTLPVLPHTTLFRRRDGERIGWFDPTFRYAAEDKDFFARLARLGPVAYVPKVVSLVRRGHTSLTRNSMRTEYWAMHLYRKHLQELEGNPQTVPLKRRLQWRIAVSLERIAAHLGAGIELPDYIPAGYLRQWLSLTTPRDRARYRWQTWVRQPIRRLIRGPG